jgi:hypothetical protein
MVHDLPHFDRQRCHYLAIVSVTRRSHVLLHPRQVVDEVLRLVAEGWNDCEISRATRVSRTTVRSWRTAGPPGRGSGARKSACPRGDVVPLDEPAYSYLLGLYLGDGYISRDPRTYRLRIFQDRRYRHLIALARQAIARVRRSEIGNVGLVEAGGMRRQLLLLEPLGVRLPPARCRDEASTVDSPRRLAARDRRPVPSTAPARPDPFRWLPGHESRVEGEVRVPEVLLHEYLGGYSRNLP